VPEPDVPRKGYVVTGEIILHREDVKGYEDNYHLDVWAMLCNDMGLDPEKTEMVKLYPDILGLDQKLREAEATLEEYRRKVNGSVQIQKCPRSSSEREREKQVPFVDAEKP
jgi:hypothetical protein